MTINIGLVTSDGLVLGCDSIASMTKNVIDPFSSGSTIEKDSNGTPLTDKDGNHLIAVKPENIQRVVSSTFGGVTKMFKIYDQNNMNIAAVTSGMGKLCDRTISGVVSDFYEIQLKRSRPFANVEPVIKAFLKFIRAEYEKHYNQAGIPEQFWTPLNFLIGGYGKTDKFPSLYEIRVNLNDYQKHFNGIGNNCGMAWGGQADSVERLIKGFSSGLQSEVNNIVDKTLAQYRQDMENRLIYIFTQIVTKNGNNALSDIKIDLPAVPTDFIDWSGHILPIDYANLPMQDAIDFVSAMVNAQSGLQKFSTTIATVGGRTHIGVAQKGHPFRMLNEKPLAHDHTGYNDV